MSNEIIEKLADAVVKGKIKEAKPLAEQALMAGLEPQDIIFNGLNKAMNVVGQKYENKQYFLPQVLLAAQTMYQALDVVLPKLKVDTRIKSTGKVVIGVVEGDVHDIGKNILKVMLTSAGLTIYDMGRDVPVKNLIDKTKAEGAQILATSTLMTQTLSFMKEIEKALIEEGQKGKIKTIIGGGATSKDFAHRIGADAWAYDAIEAVKTIDGMLS